MHGRQRYEVPATECPRIPVAFLEEERASLPARIYRQEHSYSFEDVEDAVFGYDLIERAVTPEVAPLFGGGLARGSATNNIALLSLGGS